MGDGSVVAYTRRSNETDLEYIERLITGKSDGIYDIDYSELFKLAFDTNISSTEARKRFYGIRMLLPYINKEKIRNTSHHDILKELKIKKQELEKEKIKVRTEKIDLNQMLREEARFELFTEKVIKAIDSCGIIINREKVYKPSHSEVANEKAGLLIFSDAHYGKELTVKGLRGEVINRYDTDVFESRMYLLLEKTIEIIEQEEFTEIDIFNLGDEIEGIIRVSQLMSLKMGVIDSAVGFAYFMASWLNELSKYVNINYYSTEGNHTELRLLTNKKGDFPHENMSRVIQILIREIIKDNPNIKVCKNETDKIFTNILGFNILGIHGEEKNLLQVIKDLSFVYDVGVDYLVTGHKHHANSINLGVDKGCIGVGSIIGVDDFSMKIRKTSNPTATFAILEEGVGKVTEHIIYLN